MTPYELWILELLREIDQESPVVLPAHVTDYAINTELERNKQ